MGATETVNPSRVATDPDQKEVKESARAWSKLGAGSFDVDHMVVEEGLSPLVKKNIGKTNGYRYTLCRIIKEQNYR